MLCVIDEFTREALAIRVKRRLNSTDVLETLARVDLSTVRDFAQVLAAELADESSHADCVVVTGALRPSVRGFIVRLRAERPTSVVYVGRPGPDEAPLVDAVVPGDFDWRSSRALPLRA